MAGAIPASLTTFWSETGSRFRWMTRAQLSCPFAGDSHWIHPSREIESTGFHPQLWVPDTTSPAKAERRKTRNGGRNPRCRTCVETPRVDTDRSNARETRNRLSAPVGASWAVAKRGLNAHSQRTESHARNSYTVLPEWTSVTQLRGRRSAPPSEASLSKVAHRSSSSSRGHELSVHRRMNSLRAHPRYLAATARSAIAMRPWADQTRNDRTGRVALRTKKLPPTTSPELSSNWAPCQGHLTAVPLIVP
jgi:hypothetical protein